MPKILGKKKRILKYSIRQTNTTLKSQGQTSWRAMRSPKKIEFLSTKEFLKKDRKWLNGKCLNVINIGTTQAETFQLERMHRFSQHVGKTVWRCPKHIK
jgi:hypothetical protein